LTASDRLLSLHFEPTAGHHLCTIAAHRWREVNVADGQQVYGGRGIGGNGAA
jgi:hypothetical protein